MAINHIRPLRPGNAAISRLDFRYLQRLMSMPDFFFLFFFFFSFLFFLIHF